MKNQSKRKPRIRNRIHNCRKAINLSQKEAAFLMGMDHSQISKWERGEKEPGIYNAIGLAVVTRRTVEDVFLDYRQEWQEKIGERMKLLGPKRQNTNVLR
ncbi:MAG: helix-turn-helix transcriptional regulator [bacterium]|nr:helix-turn-helix transcriptional regulator [bacterium]